MTRRAGFLTLGAGAAASLALARPARAADNVTVAVVNSTSDVTVFIAREKGFWQNEGINVTFTQLVSGAAMIAPLGTGQLDVGAGAPAAGLYNAIARGINVRMVADKASVPPGYGFQPLMVRTDLVKSGRFKTVRDLRGMTMASNANGSTSVSMLNALLKTGGLGLPDIKHVFMGFPDMVVAFKNGSIDAALVTEPNASAAASEGVAQRIVGNDAFYPHQQIAAIMYGPKMQQNRDLALRFLRGYIRACRFYNDNLRGGKIAGPNAEEVVRILAQDGPVKNEAVLRTITPSGVDPNGRLNTRSIQIDFEFFKSQNQIEGNVRYVDAIDETYANAVATQLGPYRKRA